MAEVFQKDGVWYAEFYVRNPKTGDFDRQRKSTRIKVDGTVGAKKRAKVVADEMERSSTDPLLRKSANKTVADAVGERLDAMDVRKAAAKTIERFRNSRAHLFRLLGQDTKCAAIERGDLREYAAKRQREGAASDTVRRELVELRASFREAGEPVPDMPDLPPPVARERWTTASEIARLCDELPPHRARVVRLVAQTGVRKNEVYALRRVSPGTGRLVGKTNLKTGPRTIALTPLAERLLEGGPLQRWPNALRDLKAAARRAGLGEINWNDIRAGTATQLLQAGVAPAKIAAQLGHKSLRMLEQRYARLKNLVVTADDLKALSQE